MKTETLSSSSEYLLFKYKSSVFEDGASTYKEVFIKIHSSCSEFGDHLHLRISSRNRFTYGPYDMDHIIWFIDHKLSGTTNKIRPNDFSRSRSIWYLLYIKTEIPKRLVQVVTYDTKRHRGVFIWQFK